MEIIKKAVKSKGFLAFVMGFVLYILIFLPDLVINGGILYGSGDYNVQSVPFVYHIRECILEGKDLFWDHSSGLGGQFLTMYSHVIFSPFTWIYMIVPYSAMPYAIFYVTALKSAVGALLSYLYIKRYVSNPHYAVIGALLYTFSSFNAWNLVYMAVEVAVFFPLLLIALDELCLNNRRGVFALTVVFCALLSYMAFFGNAVFCIIYFFIRCADKESGYKIKKLFSVAIESIIGCLMAMVALLPIIMTITSNDRATSFIQPENMLLYDDIFDYLKIIQSAFMVPDPFAFISLFPEKETTYPMGTIIASVAAFIPLFSASGVISYAVARKKTWQSILIAVCTIMAMVPVLNQSFTMFNSAYYARWYFMPMLICVMMSVKAVEEKISFKPGIIVSVGVFAALVIYQLLVDPEWINESSVAAATTSTPMNAALFVVTALSLIMLVIIVNSKRDKEFIPKLYIFTVVGCYSVFGIMAYYFLTSSGEADKSRLIADYNYNEEVPEGIDDSARIAIPSAVKNYNLVWGLDSVSYFNSIYDEGFADFMEHTSFVMKNGRYIDIPHTLYEINDLLSVKYYYSTYNPEDFDVIMQENDEEEKTIKDVTIFADFGGGVFYENNNYIPMGFTYDTMISTERYHEITDYKNARRTYIKYLVVENPDDFAGILNLSNDNVNNEITDEEYFELIEKRRAETCYDLVKNNSGLTAKINLSRENVVFFSISYNDSWKAYVDGAETDVYKVNNGMIGVIVPEGEHEIEFVYTVKGLKEGAVISVLSLAAFITYLIIAKRKDKKVCL